jgi:tetratricopeptide (TPR) repeat protein
VTVEPARRRPPRVRSAADCLAAALRARTSQARAEWARRGLAIDTEELDPELQVLLLRQLYLSFVEEDQLSPALAIADQMARVGPMRDIALHDRARALWARSESAERGEVRLAIEAQRQAARIAPPDRRSFHAMALGTLLHFAGEHDAALRALARAERWSHRDRPLIRGYRAYVELDAGLVPEGIEETRRALGASPLREGYGQFVLGMIAFSLGDRRRAAVHLRAFLRKNASVERAKALTLREELRRARRALADLESD